MRVISFLLAATLGPVLLGVPVAASSGPVPAPQLASLADYQLVWSDEFENPGLPDPTKWTFEKGFKRNSELQWYQEENAFVEDGKLVIEGRRERRPNPVFQEASEPEAFRNRKFINFTSASVTTKGLHAWQYGRFEVRARFAAEQGLWPAIWTLGVDGRWPANGEIDLLEYYDGSILANFAWAERELRTAHWQGRKFRLETLTDDAEWDKKFHTWTMEWDEREISLWLDGDLLNRIDLHTVRNRKELGPIHPFRQPHYLLLNLALGGQSGGPVKDTNFPTRYEIDYVRVYQRAEQER